MEIAEEEGLLYPPLHAPTPAGEIEEGSLWEIGFEAELWCAVRSQGKVASRGLWS